MSTSVFEEMVGRTMKSAVRDGDEIIFTAEDGHKFRFYHSQDCCESVSIDDVCGDLNDLVRVPLVMAERADSEPPERGPDDYVPESETWTFYRFATEKGFVTVRWYGTSNGYYSESVDIQHLGPNGEELGRY